MSTRILAAAILLITVAGGGAQSTTQATAPPNSADPDHPFSDPIWSPVREATRVSCVNTNCDGPYHGYDAIDLIGERGDPIYAAGAGVFHIGDIAPGCTTGTPTGGTWVWVDHGAAGLSRYHHLDSVTAVEGQLVTPNTQIGTMGNSGDRFPCETNYLHMELRDSAIVGKRLPIPNSQACIDGDLVVVPEQLGFASWDDVTPHRHSTPQTDNSCMPPNWSTTPDRPLPVAVRPGVGSMTLELPQPPADADSTRARLELFHPSLGRYGYTIEIQLGPESTQAYFGDLLTNRQYRASVAHHNTSGWSDWSEPVTSNTGFIPFPPPFRGLSSTSTTIWFGWFRARNVDAEHEVAIRRYEDPTWGPWTYEDVDPSQLSHRFDGLLPGVTYQVTVRAHSEFGIGEFAPYRVISTVCETSCPPPRSNGQELARAVRLNQQSQG